MKIQILGTAAAEGWPALFCNCEACRRAREKGGKNIRTRAGTLIDDQLLIDFSADTIDRRIREILQEVADLSQTLRGLGYYRKFEDKGDENG